MTLAIELNESQTRQLEETARRLNISVTDLARAAIQDLLNGHDDNFENAIQRVLQKNAELYKRLA